MNRSVARTILYRTRVQLDISLIGLMIHRDTGCCCCSWYSLLRMESFFFVYKWIVFYFSISPVTNDSFFVAFCLFIFDEYGRCNLLLFLFIISNTQTKMTWSANQQRKWYIWIYMSRSHLNSSYQQFNIHANLNVSWSEHVFFSSIHDCLLFLNLCPYCFHA